MNKKQQKQRRKYIERIVVQCTRPTAKKNDYRFGENIPGESLTGTVDITNIKPIPFKAIKVTCHICCGVSPIQNTTSSWVAEEQYFNSTVKVADEGTLEKGSHSFPFTFLIPATVPTTYWGTYGSAECTLEASIDSPLVSTTSRKRPELILNPLNLNDVPNIQDTNSSSVTKDFSDMKNGTIVLKSTSDQRGYTSGQVIHLETELENRSGEPTSTVVAKFMQKETYLTKTPIHVVKTIATIEGTGVVANNKAKWREKIRVPPLPQSRLQSCCRLIDIEYYIEVSLKSPDVSVILPIVIGDIRLATANSTPPPTPPAVPEEPQPETPATPQPETPATPQPETPATPQADFPTPTPRPRSRRLCGCFSFSRTPPLAGQPEAAVMPQADMMPQADVILTKSHSQPQNCPPSPHGYYKMAFLQTYASTDSFV